jgi:hypothetical protein
MINLDKTVAKVSSGRFSFEKPSVLVSTIIHGINRFVFSSKDSKTHQMDRMIYVTPQPQQFDEPLF